MSAVGQDIHAADGEIDVRVAAQRLADGRTEFALQERREGEEWSERRLPRSRFFPVDASVGRWLASSPLAVGLPGVGEIEVRVTTQLLADGRMEFALQERREGEEWGERRLPDSRFLPAEAPAGRWLASSPLAVSLPDPDGERVRIEVRVAAQLLADGRMEFAIQERREDVEWGERRLPRSRFLPAAAPEDRWLASSPLTVSAPGATRDIEVRVAAQRLSDGRTQFALQERRVDGEWGPRRLPRSRFFPAGAAVGRWLASSPLAVSLLVPDPPPDMPAPSPTSRPALPPVELNISASVTVSAQHRAELVGRAIAELRDQMPESATKIEGLPWAKDGIAIGELNALRGLILLAKLGYAPGLIEEPWVVHGKNHAALESLWFLAINHPETLGKIMSHPTIRDGITDQEAKILATLTTAANPAGFFLDDHDLLDKLLDPGQVTLEERTITLPLAGETDITIIRTGPGVDSTMDYLEKSVRSIEEFMGLPFPRRQVIYLFVQAPGGGMHLGNHVQIRADEQSTSGESMLTIIAHEASHYYWTGAAGWLVEGAATFMESVVKGTLHGPYELGPCTLAQTISEFEELAPDPESWVYHDCQYSLGERLFRDLYHSMDETAFRRAFRRLYLHTVFDAPDECDNSTTTICHVKEAFTAFVPEGMRSVVEEVFARRYGDTDLADGSIEGVITGPDGRSHRQTALGVNRGGVSHRVETAPDGTFDVAVQSGSFSLEVYVLVDTEWRFVGWYDGKGGTTADPGQAFRVIVRGTAVEGIQIRLPPGLPTSGQ